MCNKIAIIRQLTIDKVRKKIGKCNLTIQLNNSIPSAFFFFIGEEVRITPFKGGGYHVSFWELNLLYSGSSRGFGLAWPGFRRGRSHHQYTLDRKSTRLNSSHVAIS